MAGDSDFHGEVPVPPWVSARRCRLLICLLQAGQPVAPWDNLTKPLWLFSLLGSLQQMPLTWVAYTTDASFSQVWRPEVQGQGAGRYLGRVPPSRITDSSLSTRAPFLA